MDLLVYDDEDRRYVPWLVSLAAVVLVALLAAGTTFVLTRSEPARAIEGGSGPAPATAPTADSEASGTESEAAPGPGSSADLQTSCSQALAAADTVLERATSVEEALAEHTRIMDELLAQRITSEQALDRTLPVLTSAATDRTRFAEERTAYQRSRDACTR